MIIYDNADLGKNFTENAQIARKRNVPCPETVSFRTFNFIEDVLKSHNIRERPTTKTVKKQASPCLTVFGYGFLGRSIVDWFRNTKQGVNVVNRLHNQTIFDNNITFYASGADQLRVLQKVVKPSGIFVFSAGATFPNLPKKELSKHAQNEVDLINLVAQVCAKKRATLVYLSSSSVYGEVKTGRAKESDPLQPVGHYAVHKVRCENLISKLSREMHFKVVILRLSNPFGWQQHLSTSNGFVVRLILDLVKGISTEIHGDGTQVRDYFHVSLIGLVIEKIISNPNNTPLILNVCSGSGMTNLEVVEEVERLTKRRLKVRLNQKKHPGIHRSVLDPTQLNAWLDHQETNDPLTNNFKRLAFFRVHGNGNF